MTFVTNTTSTDNPRNPWTGEPLPPLPAVSHPENWKFRLEPDGDMYCIYDDDEHAPMALTFDVYAWDDGKLECSIMSWTSDQLDPDQLEKDTARMPEWIAEIRAVTQWAHEAFEHNHGAR
jgi:hypothetical protein